MSLSLLFGILMVSSKHPDCSPSTGSRSGQAPPPEWPAKMTEVGPVGTPYRGTDSRILFVLRPLTLSGHDLWST